MTIALYHGISWLSRVIQCFNWSPYSHASIVDDDESNYDAWRGGVRRTGSFRDGHTRGTRVDFFDFVEPLNPAEKDLLRHFLRHQLYCPYDYLGILGFVFRRDEGSNWARKWFCSELVFAACDSIGRRLLQQIPAWRVYPGMISYSPLLCMTRSETV